MLKCVDEGGEKYQHWLCLDFNQQEYLQRAAADVFSQQDDWLEQVTLLLLLKMIQGNEDSDTFTLIHWCWPADWQHYVKHL